MPNPFLKNARIVVEVSCQAQPGESVLILTDANEGRVARAQALAAAATELGALPAIMDVSDYKVLWKQSEAMGPVFPQVKAAVEAADITINIGGPRFDTVLGDADAWDYNLTCAERRVYLMCGGMDVWEITPEEVAAIRNRAVWLLELLDSSQTVHVASPAGTDFTFGLGPGAKWLPILGIVPLYGEVAITPQQGSETGIFVVDGPTQGTVRPKTEQDREPLRITVENGRAKDIAGYAAQVDRLKAFIASGDPPADSIDEVGILTTQIQANDVFHWDDGTHHHDCAHIALGNNPRRDALVHGPKHMDGEIRKPTITIDGKAVVENGVFLDDLVSGAAGETGRV